ncbi:MAG: glycosyltransferase family 39 protein [Gemmatales bacterium]
MIPALTPSEWQWCAHLSSSLAGLLLILPLYGLARCFYSIRTAWLGTLLFIMLPVVVQTTTDALSESWYLLFLFGALWTLVHGVRSQRSSWFVMTGLLSGAAYLVRIEAVVLPAAVGVWTLLSRWHVHKPLPSGCCVRNLGILAVCFVLPPLPYMVTIGKLSNRPVMQTIANNSEINFTDNDVLFASHRLQDGVDGIRRAAVKWSEALWLVTSSLGRAGHFLIWPFAGLGMFILWRTRRSDPALLLLISLCVLYGAMLLRLAFTSGYATERHTLTLVALAAQTAALGLIAVAQWLRRTLVHARWGRHLTALLGLGMIAICLPKDVQPLHRNQEGHRQAGLWLEHHLEYADQLVDPYRWASYYAGLVFQTRPTATLTSRVLGIVDPQETDLNRQHDWQAAGLQSQEATTVWCWPSAQHPKVLIRATRPTQTAQRHEAGR